MLGITEKKQLLSDPALVRGELQSATQLHWFHWSIIILSLTLSFIAWRYSVSVVEAQIEDRFDRECDQVIELVFERMKNYEDALWSAVAMMRAVDGKVNFDHWQENAISLNIENKYLGINGIGPIHALSKQQIPGYLDEQRSPRPDLILLDLNMPRKDGRETLAEIKNDLALKSISVVVLTTSDADHDIHQSYDLQASCYVTKPVDMAQFTKVVQSLQEFWLCVVEFLPN